MDSTEVLAQDSQRRSHQLGVFHDWQVVEKADLTLSFQSTCRGHVFYKSLSPEPNGFGKKRHNYTALAM